MPGIVWRARQCGWLKIGKSEHGHDVWEKPNGQRIVVRTGVEPLVPVRPERAPVEAGAREKPHSLPDKKKPLEVGDDFRGLPDPKQSRFRRRDGGNTATETRKQNKPANRS